VHDVAQAGRRFAFAAHKLAESDQQGNNGGGGV
jgi:hypothetical protein